MKRGKPRPLNRVLLHLLIWRLFLPLIVLTLLAFGLAGYLGGRSLGSRQLQLARSLGRTVGDYLEHASRVLGAMARVAETVTPEELTLYMQATWQAYGYFDALYRLDEKGIAAALVPPDPRYQRLDMSGQPYFRQAQAQTGVAISQPFTSLRTGQPAVHMARALADGGLVVGELNLGALQQAVTAGLDETGLNVIFVADRSGTLLAHPQPDQVAQQTNVGDLEIVQRGLADETTLIYTADGSLFLGGAVPVKQIGWVVVAQAPLAVAYGPYLWMMALVLLLSSAVWLVLVWNLGWQFRRHAVAPLKRLSQGTDALAAGYFAQSKALAAVPAAFAEVGALAANFERMSQAIQARQEALRASEQRFRGLFERVPIGLYRTTPAGEILDVNPALLQMLGYPDRQALMAISATDVFVDSEERSREQALLEREGVVHDFEVQLRRCDGSIIWAWDNVRAVGGADGRALYYEGSLEDVTEHKRAEEERRELEGKLERAQRMESLGVLAGGVAHDLNNILGPLVAYPDLILIELPENSPIRDDVLQVRRAAERAAAVVQDLLTLARRGAYQMIPLNLNTIVEQYLHSPSFADLKGRNPNVFVDANLAPDLLNLAGSVPHLSKVLMNLVINAFEAMPYGGQLTISTSCESLDRSIVGYDYIEARDYVVLRVSDSGVGIEEKDLDRIFEPFYTKKEMGRSGSGLGLAVVHGVVRDHSGRVDVHTEVARGTDFVLYFPVTREVPMAAEEERKDYSGRERVLVVDDLAEQREVAARLLSSLGYEVETVESGRAAVSYLAENDVDILVLDMIMEEDFDGLDAYHEIVKARPEQKAIIASGFSETERVREMQRMGAGQFVKKPYTLKKIGKAVRQELDRG